MLLSIKLLFARLLNQLLDFIFPRSCYICRDFTLESDALCPKCWSKLNFVTEPLCIKCGTAFNFDMGANLTCPNCIQKDPYFDKARHLIKFKGTGQDLIHNFKYNDQTNLAKFFANLLMNAYSEEIKNYDLIIPIPMHKMKRLFRLYNHAALLAKELALISDLIYTPEILVKAKYTKSQASLDRDSRLTNVKNSMIIIKSELLKDKKIILLDDVMTTGATINEATKLLKKNGAKKVFVLTIAKSYLQRN